YSDWLSEAIGFGIGTAALFDVERIPSYALLGVVCHEVGHALEFQVWREHNGIARPQSTAELGVTCSQPLPKPPADEPWWGDLHGAVFIRSCLNFAHRVGLSWLPDMCICEPFGLSSVWKYKEALGNEPADRRSEAITEIISSPATPEFSALFAADVER